MDLIVGGVLDPLILHKVIIIAILVEITTNFIKTIIPDLEKRYITIVAGGIGILVASLTGISILSTLDIPIAFQPLDYVLTGIIVSRGANIVHDLSKKLNF